MAKIFSPVTTSNLANQASITAAIDQNFAALSSLLLDVFSLSGVTPNQLKTNLDCNSNAILNMPAPVSVNSPARLIDVTSNPTITVPPVGTSGSTVPLLNGINIWSGLQTFTTPTTFTTTAAVSGSFIGSKTTAITTDGYQNILSQSNTTTAANIYSPIVPANYFFNDDIRSVLELTAGSTVVVGSNYGAYCLNNTPFTGSFGVASVNFFGLSIANVNQANVWGINTTVRDSSTNVGLATTGRVLVGWEADFSVYSNNAGTIVEGISFELFANSAGGVGNVFQVSLVPGSVGQWTNGFVVNDGAAQVGAIFGALATGANQLSMPINFGIYDSGSTGHYIQIQGLPVGTQGALKISDNIHANYLVLETGSTGTAPAIFVGGTDTNINLVLAGKGTGTIQTITSVVSNYLLATPAAASSVAAYKMGTANVGVYWGTGTPNGVVTAPQGSMYIRTDGGASTGLYLNKDSGTTWGAVTSG